MRRSVIITLLVFSVVFVIFPAKPTTAIMFPTTTMTTLTSTFTSTLTGTRSTTVYQTFTQVTSVRNMTRITYTTTIEVVVPVEVMMTTVAAVITCRTPQLPQIYTATYSQAVSCSTVYETITSKGEYNYPSQVRSTGTSQYTTTTPLTLFSTTATTSTYTTVQATSITNTQTSTTVREGIPSLSQLIWILFILPLVAALLLLAKFWSTVGNAIGNLLKKLGLVYERSIAWY